MGLFKFLLVLILFPLLATAQPEDWHKGLNSRIDYIINKSGLKRENISLSISYESFDKDVTLYKLNDNKLRVPASLSKLYTAGAALSKIDPAHKYITKLVSTATITDSVLNGDIYLVGGGDPSFVSEDMWKLVNQFIRAGVKTISGNIIVDDSLFDSIRFDPGRDKSRVDRAYDAPIGAMSFNWNSVNVYVRPAAIVGKKARVYTDPANNYIELINKTVTAKKGIRTNVKVTRIKSGKAGHDIVKVTGQIAKGAKEKVVYKNISQPALWSGKQLVAFLKQRGVKVEGGVQTGRAPASATTLAFEKSKPVGDVVKDMMKFSNNYVAEMLTKQLSVQAGDSVGNMSGGIRELQKFIVETGVPSGEFSFKSPSGLTKNNKFKSKHLVASLNYLKEQFLIFPELLVSMPISGVDGTMKGRLKDKASRGWVRAKTGMLSGAIGLAGFAKSRRRPIFTFAFIYNGSVKKRYKARDLADRIAFALVNES